MVGTPAGRAVQYRTENREESRSMNVTVTAVDAPAVARRRATGVERRALMAAGYALPDLLNTEILADGSRRWTRLHKRGTCDCRDASCPRPAGSSLKAHRSKRGDR
jgi:hypothetical protein